MKKTILSVFALVVAFVATADAQQKVFLNKGSRTVDAVVLGADDYISFGRPEGVPDQLKAEVSDLKAGKNYVKYTVTTKTDDQPFYQMCVSESYLKFFILQYFGGASLSEMTEAELKQVFSTLMMSGSYGYAGVGSQSVTLVDGEKPEGGTTQFIAAGENHYVVVCDLVEADGKYTLGKDMTYGVVRTADPGESKATLSVEYLGLNSEGKPEFDVKPGSAFKSLHLVLGSTKSIDEFVNLYGYGALMYTQGVSFSAEQWATYASEFKAWSIEKENDYSFYALAVDANGDWVKASVDNVHIKPAAANDCPEVDVTNHLSGNGDLAIEYTIKSKASSIKSARMLVMKENDWDDALNAYDVETPSMAWADFMATTDKAQDVTDVVKQFNGKFTFKKSFSDAERGWYVAVLAVTDEYGTTVSRSTFHSHITDAEFGTLTKTFPVE